MELCWEEDMLGKKNRLIHAAVLVAHMSLIRLTKIYSGVYVKCSGKEGWLRNL